MYSWFCPAQPHIIQSQRLPTYLITIAFDHRSTELPNNKEEDGPKDSGHASANISNAEHLNVSPVRSDTGFLAFSFPRSLGSGVYDEIN